MNENYRRFNAGKFGTDAPLGVGGEFISEFKIPKSDEKSTGVAEKTSSPKDKSHTQGKIGPNTVSDDNYTWNSADDQSFFGSQLDLFK